MHRPFVCVFSLIFAAALIGQAPIAQAKPGKPPAPSARREALAKVRELQPQIGRQALTIVGSVTPAVPLATPDDPHRLGLQMGQGKGLLKPPQTYLRWDSVNNRLSIPANDYLGSDLSAGPYGGLLFTIRANKRYVVLCKGDFNTASGKWSMRKLAQGGDIVVLKGTFSFMTEPITGSGGYADLVFGFDQAIQIDACWMFSFDVGK